MHRAIVFAFSACLAMLGLLSLFGTATPALAQRPTPTTIPTEPTVSATPAPTAVPASDTPANGSIRGTVYQDTNQNGQCGSGDPVVADIPIQFVSNDGETVLFLQSGSDGTFGLVAAGYGTWQVSAQPPAPWRVTSTTPQPAFLDNDNRVVQGVDFCVTNTAVTATSSLVLLPTAGAQANNAIFIWATLTGALLILAGLALKRLG